MKLGGQVSLCGTNSFKFSVCDNKSRGDFFFLKDESVCICGRMYWHVALGTRVRASAVDVCGIQVPHWEHLKA